MPNFRWNRPPPRTPALNQTNLSARSSYGSPDSFPAIRMIVITSAARNLLFASVCPAAQLALTFLQRGMRMATNPRPISATATAAQPTPMRFFQTMLAYQQTAAMEAALDLDIFTAIAQ